jgi:predicted kinase
VRPCRVRLIASLARVARVILINGAPGTGKSTIAHQLAQDRPLDLALDLDVLKHSLGQWDADMTAAGYHARRLGLAVVGTQIDSGHDVYVGQFLAKTEFIDQLQSAAEAHGAAFLEVILTADVSTLQRRLMQRALRPERAEHLTNASLVSAKDVPTLVRAIDRVATLRPGAKLVDASGELDATVERMRRVLAGD